jgi:Spy/CpxP family protein refolding chaperone
MEMAESRPDGTFGIVVHDAELETVRGEMWLHTMRGSVKLTDEQVNGISAVIERYREEKK